MAFDEGLAERLREIFADRPRVIEKKMFGGLAFMSPEFMFVGIIGDALLARVGPEGHAEALSRPHVRVMAFTGKPMKGYVIVDPGGIENDEDLAYWVERSEGFVRTLPPKKK